MPEGSRSRSSGRKKVNKFERMRRMRQRSLQKSITLHNDQAQSSKKKRKSRRDSKVLGHHREDSKVLEHQRQDSKVLEHQRQDNKALEHQRQGSKVLEHKRQGSKVKEHQRQSSRAERPRRDSKVLIHHRDSSRQLHKRSSSRQLHQQHSSSRQSQRPSSRKSRNSSKNLHRRATSRLLISGKSSLKRNETPPKQAQRTDKNRLMVEMKEKKFRASLMKTEQIEKVVQENLLLKDIRSVELRHFEEEKKIELEDMSDSWVEQVAPKDFPEDFANNLELREELQELFMEYSMTVPLVSGQKQRRSKGRAVHINDAVADFLRCERDMNAAGLIQNFRTQTPQKNQNRRKRSVEELECKRKGSIEDIPRRKDSIEVVPRRKDSIEVPPRRKDSIEIVPERKKSYESQRRKSIDLRCKRRGSVERKREDSCGAVDFNCFDDDDDSADLSLSNLSMTPSMSMTPVKRSRILSIDLSTTLFGDMNLEQESEELLEGKVFMKSDPSQSFERPSRTRNSNEGVSDANAELETKTLEPVTKNVLQKEGAAKMQTKSPEPKVLQKERQEKSSEPKVLQKEKQVKSPEPKVPQKAKQAKSLEPKVLQMEGSVKMEDKSLEPEVKMQTKTDTVKTQAKTLGPVTKVLRKEDTVKMLAQLFSEAAPRAKSKTSRRKKLNRAPSITDLSNIFEKSEPKKKVKKSTKKKRKHRRSSTIGSTTGFADLTSGIDARAMFLAMDKQAKKTQAKEEPCPGCGKIVFTRERGPKSDGKYWHAPCMRKHIYDQMGKGKTVDHNLIDHSGLCMKSTQKKFFKLDKKNKDTFGRGCQLCQKEIFITEDQQIWNGGRYHRCCFRCSVCDNVLRQQNFKSQHGILYCFRCYDEEILIPEAANIICYDDLGPINVLESTFEMNDQLMDMCHLSKQFKITFMTISMPNAKWIVPELFRAANSKQLAHFEPGLDLSPIRKIRVSARSRGVTKQSVFDEFVASLILSGQPRLGLISINFKRDMCFREKFICVLWLPEDSSKVLKLLYGSAMGVFRRRVDGVSRVFTFSRPQELCMDAIVEDLRANTF